MHLIRRAALRAASSPSTFFLSKPRSITTSSPFVLRSKAQSPISSSIFRRFNSDEASNEEESQVKSAHREQDSMKSAIDSVTESISSSAESAKDAMTDSAVGAAAAAGAYMPREDRGGFNGDRRDYGDNRGRFERREERVVTPTNTIYVGNLLFDITAADLEREFASFGTLKNARVQVDSRGLSKGFGYVEFETIDEANAAIQAKHQSILEGRRLVVNFMTKTRKEFTPNPPSKTLFIGNLAFEMSDADLNKLFRDIRNVIDVRVAIDRRTGQPRGFAHADFVDIESATKGKEALADLEIYGRKLRVDYSAGSGAGRGNGAFPRDDRTDSRRGDRGGRSNF